MKYTKRERKRLLKIVYKSLRLRWDRSRACRRAGIHRNTLMRWRDNDPEVREMLDEIWDSHLDRSEYVYTQMSKDGEHEIATIHTLRTHRTRDWGTYEEQQLIREREEFNNTEFQFDTWQEPIDVLELLKKHARQGLNADMLAFRCSVLPDRLKEVIRDGIRGTDATSIKVAVSIVGSWALYNEKIKKDFKGAVLSTDSITTWQELSGILTAKNIGEDIESLLKLEDDKDEDK